MGIICNMDSDKTLSIVGVQFNPIVGDVQGNCARIIAFARKHKNADVVVFPEMAVSGYPVEDLLFRPSFVDLVKNQVGKLALALVGLPAVIVGTPWYSDEEGCHHNTALLIRDGKVTDMYHKCKLPNYGVFDEKRFFKGGPLDNARPFDINGVKVGILVCEDMWSYEVPMTQKQNGADFLLCINGSPFEFDKDKIRVRNAQNRVNETGLPLMYVNLVGGQDELVFDGGSFYLNPNGKPRHCCSFFEEKTFETTFAGGRFDGFHKDEFQYHPADKYESIYNALIVGIRDYIIKNGFKGVVLGMSGGIDSALCAAIATDALGKDKVFPYMLPSPYTSEVSITDAADCTKRLGLTLRQISIEPAMQAFDTMMADEFKGEEKDITEENIQSRIRMTTLMALSNKKGYMLVSTGNKSELSVGYSTLYGDLSGGFAVIKDIFKMSVFHLCRWRNAHAPSLSKNPVLDVIPRNILEKPPTAELRSEQTDEDSLPPYPILDDILGCMVEEEMSIKDIVRRGHDADVVQKVRHMVDKAEYKRRQAPPGVKITFRSFGKERRYPITNHMRFQTEV